MVKWFYSDSMGVVKGPYTEKEMFELYLNGRLRLQFKVKTEADNNFVTLRDLMQLRGGLPFSGCLLHVSSCEQCNCYNRDKSNIETPVSHSLKKDPSFLPHSLTPLKKNQPCEGSYLLNTACTSEVSCLLDRMTSGKDSEMSEKLNSAKTSKVFDKVSTGKTSEISTGKGFKVSNRVSTEKASRISHPVSTERDSKVSDALSCENSSKILNRVSSTKASIMHDKVIAESSVYTDKGSKVSDRMNIKKTCKIPHTVSSEKLSKMLDVVNTEVGTEKKFQLSDKVIIGKTSKVSTVKGFRVSNMLSSEQSSEVPNTVSRRKDSKMSDTLSAVKASKMLDAASALESHKDSDTVCTAEDSCLTSKSSRRRRSHRRRRKHASDVAKCESLDGSETTDTSVSSVAASQHSNKKRRCHSRPGCELQNSNSFTFPENTVTELECVKPNNQKLAPRPESPEESSMSVAEEPSIEEDEEIEELKEQFVELTLRLVEKKIEAAGGSFYQWCLSSLNKFLSAHHASAVFELVKDMQDINEVLEFMSVYTGKQDINVVTFAQEFMVMKRIFGEEKENTP